MPRWARRFLGPVHRPDPDYAQPSHRYLQLLRDGAAEHELPEDYQAWLGALQAYTLTRERQRLGQLALVLLFGPLWGNYLGENPLERPSGPDYGAIVRLAAPTLALALVLVATMLWAGVSEAHETAGEHG